MPLVDPYLKTTRAKEHLDCLKKEIGVFIGSAPCRFREQSDIKNQRYRIKVELTDPPIRLSLIAGDIFGCLRASLDHLIWDLATRNTAAYAEGTQFPILEQEDARRFKSQTNGIPAEAVNIIEHLQPYHPQSAYGVKGHPLWRLNKLCNIDKHRRIPVHGATVDFRLHESLGPPTYDNDDTMSFPLSAKGEMTLHPTATYRIVFGDAKEGIECDVLGIEAIYEFVTNEVLPKFERFFG